MVNEDITAALDKRHIEIFKKDWYVAWFKKSSSSKSSQKEEIKRPELFNNEHTRRALRKFLLEASDMLLLFKFVGIYYVKDMEKWIDSMSKLDKEYIEKNGLPLPFGVIPLENTDGAATKSSSSTTNTGGGGGVTYKSACYGNYVVYTDTRTLQKKTIFECNDEARASLYEFDVFDIGARFVSVFDATVAVPNSSQNLAFNQSKNITSHELVPASVFMSLYKARSEIEEYIVYRGDANFNLSHPPTFLSAKPLPNAEIEVIPEDVYCAMDTVLGAKQHESERKQRFAMNALQNYIDRMHQNRNMGNHVRPEDLLREQRREKYARADITEGTKAIPGFVDITMGQAPTLQVNIQDLEAQFKFNVASAVRIPYIFLRSDGQSSGGGNSSGRSSGSSAPSFSEDTINFHRNNLYEEMDHEHDVLNQLFRHLYELTYSKLDQFMITRQLGRESVLFDKNEGDDDNDDHEKEKKMMKKEKENAQKAAQFVKNITVELFFEKSVVRTSSSIPMLMQLADRYIIPLEYVAAQAYSVYGTIEEMQLDKLPPMPKQPPQESQQQQQGANNLQPKAKKPKKEEEEESSGDEDEKPKKKKEKAKPKKAVAPSSTKDKDDKKKKD